MFLSKSPSIFILIASYEFFYIVVIDLIDHGLLNPRFFLIFTQKSVFYIDAHSHYLFLFRFLLIWRFLVVDFIDFSFWHFFLSLVSYNLIASMRYLFYDFSPSYTALVDLWLFF